MNLICRDKILYLNIANSENKFIFRFVNVCKFKFIKIHIINTKNYNIIFKLLSYLNTFFLLF